MELPYIIIFAVLMGLVGALYVAVNCRIVKLRKRWSKYKRLLFLEVRTATLPCTASCRISSPY
jgi:H+/Cl- antiporter ClcA